MKVVGDFNYLYRLEDSAESSLMRNLLLFPFDFRCGPTLFL